MPLNLIAHYHDEGYALTDKWVRCRETTCARPKWDRWLCTKRTKVRNLPRYETCGVEYFYPRRKEDVAGGPALRYLDRRYGRGVPYRCKTHEGVVVQRHESAPDPDQPIQDPELAEQIARLQLVAKEARKKRGRKKASSS